MTGLPFRPSSRLLSPLGVLMATLLLLVTSVASPVAYGQDDPPGHGMRLTPEAATETEMEPWVAEAIQPELRDEVAAQMPDNLPEYVIDATLDADADGGPRLTGTLDLTWVNTTGEPIDTLPFRLYANGPDAQHDAITVGDVTVDGASVEPILSESASVLDVPLDRALGPGAEVAIGMTFITSPPTDATAHYGIFNIDPGTGTLALAHWYPVLAGRDPETGWVLDFPSRNGDPIFAETALFDVRITAPEGWRIVTTGVTFDDPATTADAVTQRYVTGPVRDFTIVADEDFELVTDEVDGIVVNSWHNPGEEAIGKAVAEYGAQSLALFNELLGPYPFRELDLLPVEMYGAAGCEFPQLIYIGHDYYSGPDDLDVPSALDFTVAHEVVHQWFYGLVGNNQYADAFIDEGLTQYLSSEVYFTAAYNEAVGDEVTASFLERPFARFVGAGDDQVVDQPTDDFEAGWAYGFAAYVKAPLGFAAIHDAIGNDAFFAALRAYVDEFMFGVATPDDLLAAFEVASGQELDELWRHWFEETNGEDDL
jgi:hypothetical protein